MSALAHKINVVNTKHKRSATPVDYRAIAAEVAAFLLER
jgi:hypothetical protein